ncbi:MAG TPA: GTP cyclohydrolase II [Rhizomicrobium sp.]|nr:GTP cyclohydrolase II [Rhizomicrobium sp.]
MDRAESAPEGILASVARAVDALRAGEILVIGDPESGSLAILAVETATATSFAPFEASRAIEPSLVLTEERARTLKVRVYTPGVVALPLGASIDPAQLRAIADPTSDLAEPLKGPFAPLRRDLPPGYAAAVRLAKLAGLLPAVVVGALDAAPHDATEISIGDIRDYDRAIVASLKLVTRARVPLQVSERAEVVAFRAGTGEPEHIAIVIGDPPRQSPVLARLHSECFTGDLLGSLRCDCGTQLREGLAALAKAGGGVLLYLAQEGRGIGLINKLRAYRLQDQGFDTVEANERLGFESDERLYGIAARMLSLLGFRSVRLMTNNPKKVAALKAEGIDVVERVPHAFPATAHNRDYLRTKAEKSGHLL